MPLRGRGTHRRDVDGDTMREEHVELVAVQEVVYRPKHLRPLEETTVGEYEYRQLPRDQ